MKRLEWIREALNLFIRMFLLFLKVFSFIFLKILLTYLNEIISKNKIL
jgi:hypothetical protein